LNRPSRIGEELRLLSGCVHTIDQNSQSRTADTTALSFNRVSRDLTICSVSFYNRPHLCLSHRLSERLNSPGEVRRWLIADNTPEGPQRLSESDLRFEQRPGVGGGHVPNHQHALALNSLVRQVRTRFLLVIDPDFFLVLGSWHRLIIDHMKRHNLSFFGVPWHPRHSDKYRYFPCVHCLFVDLDRVRPLELDFRPTAADAPGVDIEWPYRESEFRSAMERLCFGALDHMGMRRRRATYCDTGTRLYWRFRHDKRHRHEVVQPVMREAAQPSLPLKSRLLQWALPDEYCHRPKRRGYHVTDGLRERGILHGAPADWQEFMWQGEPFGFHVRRNFRKSERQEAEEITLLTRIIEFWCGSEQERQHAVASAGV
jgi:hypothetical protein